MARKYRKFDEDFRQGAVQLVVETGKPIAQVARDLGLNETDHIVAIVVAGPVVPTTTA